MTSQTLVETLVESLLLPPGINLLMALAAWILWSSWRRTARALLVISATSLYALSTPSVANALRDALPSYPPLTLKQIQELHIDNQTEPTAIVIVSAGRKVKAPEYGDVDTVNAETLELLRYGAYLHRKTKLPIMVVGGSPNGESTPEAVLMNQVLTEEFGVEVKWMQGQVKSTSKNSLGKQLPLKSLGFSQGLIIAPINIVPKIKFSFSNEKFNYISVLPNAVNINNSPKFNVLPSTTSLIKSNIALKALCSNKVAYLSQLKD